MQKKLAILLAFFIVFSPVYSNAVLPALAASVASNGGRVLVGQTIKKVAPSALANARKAAVGICAKYPKLCGGGMGALGLSLTADGWNIEITNNDVTNIDVDIYKIPQNDACEMKIAFGTDTIKNAPQGERDRLLKLIRNNPSYANLEWQAAPNWLVPYQREIDRLPSYASLSPSDILLYKDWQYKGDIPFSAQMRGNGSTGSFSNYSTGMGSRYYYKCVPYPTNKTYITNYELNEYVTNNTTNNDIDIKDIYNFDFSQYNINIGGDTYNGTTINNDLSKSDPSEADKKVSSDLKNKLDDKTISLDDVNDQNCTKNDAGEYDKCGDKTDPTDPEEPTDPEPEPPPIECDANGFYKKVCDWMDWTQKPHDKPDFGNVDIIDKSEGLNIDQNRIDFTNQCPAPMPINTSVVGFPVSTELNYQPLCDFFTMLNPFVVGMGGISSALIIAGGARRG